MLYALTPDTVMSSDFTLMPMFPIIDLSEPNIFFTLYNKEKPLTYHSKNKKNKGTAYSPLEKSRGLL
jgi:hypothetical protein